MVGASRRPGSVRASAANFLNEQGGVMLVVLYVFQLLWLAEHEGRLLVALHQQQVGQRPGIVERVCCEQRHLDVLIKVLCEHTSPFFDRVGQHTLLGGRVDLLIRNLHEIKKFNLIILLVIGIVF